jgi:hypothetical protein
LFAGFGSKLAALAVAVFIIDVLLPDPLTFTVMVTLAEAPFAIFPKLQLIVPFADCCSVSNAKIQRSLNRDGRACTIHQRGQREAGAEG